MKRFLLGAALLAGAVLPASATSITGTLDVYPYARWNYPNSTITSWYGNTLATTGTGSFAPFVTGSNLVLQDPNTTFPFSQLGHSPTNQPLFALYHHPNPIAWLNVSTIVDKGEFFWGTPTHQWTGTGVMSLVGYDPTPGAFTMTIQHGLFGYTHVDVGELDSRSAVAGARSDRRSRSARSGFSRWQSAHLGVAAPPSAPRKMTMRCKLRANR
jgi:hypothetical protein